MPVLQQFNFSIPQPALIMAKKIKSVFRRSHSVMAVEKAAEAGPITLTQAKNQVQNVARHSKQVIEALEHIGKIHPFVQVAVFAFSSFVRLELARRENDHKVLALAVSMKEMMSALQVLARVNQRDQNWDMIRERLEARINLMATNIRDCAKVCDTFQKLSTTMRVLTVLKWKSTFDGFAIMFARDQEGIFYDLQFHTQAVMVNAEERLEKIEKHMQNLMDLAFNGLRSPEEEVIEAFIESHGGSERVIEEDAHLIELLSMENHNKHHWDLRVKHKQQEDSKALLERVREQFHKSVTQVIEENAKVFAQKFEAQMEQILHTQHIVVRESDRVIKTVLAGPHERLLDPDMYIVWKEMGWKGNVKARYLVMALKDHFTECQSKMEADISNPEISGVVNTDQEHGALADYQWATQFVSIHRMQPLIEALDTDVSTFVTVSEVNAFTSARPTDWTLPYWIAYWTVGFQHAVHLYHRQMLSNLSKINREVARVHPSNRQVVVKFLESHQMLFVDILLAGLNDHETFHSSEWNQMAFEKFKGYVTTEENRISNVLKKLTYHIEEENTLVLISQSGRPEMYIMPLLYLLLSRALLVIQQGRNKILHAEELQKILTSIHTVRHTVVERINVLQAVHKLQNLDFDDHIQRFFFGLYRGLHEKDHGRLHKMISRLHLSYESHHAQWQDTSSVDSLSLCHEGFDDDTNEARCDLSHSKYCDSCGQSIGAVRITCLPCSANNVFHSMDLCSDCIDENITGEDVQWEHLASHPMLQTLISVPVSAEIARQRQAMRKLEQFNSTALDAATCHVCQEQVHQPCWLCTDCDVDTFICRTCNDGINRESPWKSGHTKHSKNFHDWSHNLLNLPLPSETTVDNAGDEDRMAQLEVQLQQIQHHVDSLGRLDDSRMSAFDIVNNRLSGIESRMTAVDTVSNRLSGIESRISDLESRLARLDLLDQKQQKLVESIGIDSQRLRRIEALLIQQLSMPTGSDTSD